MANEEHLSILNQGVQVWNQWRKDNPETRPDISGADLSGVNLRGVNLSWTNLRGANLHGAKLRCWDFQETNLRGADLGGVNLSEADLRDVDLREANFFRANLSGANLHGAFLSDANLSKADLGKANLDSAHIVEANLRGANLSEANFFRAKLSEANLTEADLSRAKLIWASLSGANLSGAKLIGANLSKANLNRAKLSEANLSGANLSEANLSVANLSRADLYGVNLSKTNLREANFFMASLIGADLKNAGIENAFLVNIDLSQANNLEDVTHWGPSSLGIETIYKSVGNIPEKFLRGCGLSDMQIAMVKLHRRGLTNEEVTNLTYDIHHLIVLGAIHAYSSFISYSMKDKAFANKIYDDLQINGVRCWFAPEDLPIGGKLRVEIDQAISRQDNVILILSEHALKSGWVEDEVELAFEVEKERGQRILLPVRLDDAVLDSDEAWAKKVRGRLVGDFRDWGTEHIYKREFNKLLRGIKATAEEGD